MKTASFGNAGEWKRVFLSEMAEAIHSAGVALYAGADPVGYWMTDDSVMIFDLPTGRVREEDVLIEDLYVDGGSRYVTLSDGHPRRRLVELGGSSVFTERTADGWTVRVGSGSEPSVAVVAPSTAASGTSKSPSKSWTLIAESVGLVGCGFFWSDQYLMAVDHWDLMLYWRSGEVRP